MTGSEGREEVECMIGNNNLVEADGVIESDVKRMCEQN